MTSIDGAGHDPEDAPADMVARCAPVRLGRPLSEAVDCFQRDPTLRLMPVVDADARPAGAIYERDMRRILFNPFGHALLQNPSFGGRLDEHVRPCPTIDDSASAQVMIDLYATHGDACEGLIVTRGGRYVGVIGSQHLLRLAAQREGRIARAKALRFERLADESAAFRHDMAGLVSDLVAMAGHLSQVAAMAAERAAHNEDQAATVAVSASQTAAGMAELAESGTQMAAVFGAIEDQVAVAGRATRDAVGHAEKGMVQTQTLADAAEEIGSVTALIDTIARATTTLALNAAIEAARAGEAGRGFAVVAREVQSLAAQTRAAAADISRRIDHIRATVGEVATGHAHMERAIGSVQHLSAAIFDAVTRQSTFSQAIALHVQEAGDAASHIHASATLISGNAHAAADGTRDIAAFAGRLSHGSRQLEDRVATFIAHVQAA
jgi:methyl-accepting chemotaxis protein